MAVDILAVMRKQRVIIGLDQLGDLRLRQPQPPIAGLEHRTATMEGGQRVPRRIEKRRMAARRKAGICRCDQVGGGIRQGPVEVENHCAHCLLLLP